MPHDMTIGQFQRFIRDKYYPTDSKRGTPGTFMWFVEEVGELATALAGKDQQNKEEEFADVFAWLDEHLDAARVEFTFVGRSAHVFRRLRARPPVDSTALAALEGKVLQQSLKLPLAKAEDPDLKDGADFYDKQSDNFFVGNSFPTCVINFSAQEIMGQTEANM